MKKYRSIRFNLAIPLTFLLIFMISPLLVAQDTDHVYLKSGSVIRGKIVVIEPADHVKIEDMCGNLWYYKITEVEKITSEPFEFRNLRDQDPVGFGAGFVNMTSIGFPPMAFLQGLAQGSNSSPPPTCRSFSM